MSETTSLGTHFTRAAIAGLLALVVFGPISGLKLNQYDVQPAFTTPLVLAGLIFTGRLAYSLLSETQFARRFFDRFALSRHVGVQVAKPGGDRSAKILAIVGLAIMVLLPFVAGKYWLTVAVSVLIYILLALGLSIVVGFAGLLDLGFVAFYAVGAYVTALGGQWLGMGMWSSLIAAAVIAAACGAILGFPVLRMHGDYLAIVTLGFGEIIRLVLNNWIEVTGGPNGLPAPAPSIFGIEFGRRATEGYTTFHELLGIKYSAAHEITFIYIVLACVVALSIIGINRLRFMPMGRAWEALREDEIACRSIGINHVTVKLSAFMMGAMTAGIAGVFFASYQKFVSPSSFTFIESAMILAIVVLGGMGSIRGAIFAAIVLTLLPEVLRDFAEYRMLAFGVLMVVIMLWRPRGLVVVRRPYIPRPELSSGGTNG